MSFKMRKLVLVIAIIYLMNLTHSSVFDRRILDSIFNTCKCTCGLPGRETRLAAGEYLTGHEFPWTASVRTGDVSLPATLISPKYLLTSAGNLIGKTPLDVKIVVGEIDRCFAGVSSASLSVDKISMHPDYDPATGAHDIAVIRLSAPVATGRRILPICLPSTVLNGYERKVGTVYGWGNDKNTCKPKKLALPILNREECLKGSSRSEYVTDDKGCAGVYGSISPVCKNETGGPVMYASRNGIYELIGELTLK